VTSTASSGVSSPATVQRRKLGATGTPLILARPAMASAVARVDVPAPLREIDVASGCAADYDAWLIGVTA